MGFAAMFGTFSSDSKLRICHVKLCSICDAVVMLQLLLSMSLLDISLLVFPRLL
jgi:hypothetical protein